ncbi:hypothetical protein OBP_017 [Pseudomonas phage OBP]|uniref:hypothetical protein n=1 Tax=Pseudomonas phage OBP TaxID=1124849 RepID=UPI000240D60E|nr:hypothetical protein OBP_017 [Pseudomonas phage OBP]AEV89454.1 hypothetical protein OBP_017 [Pseudomonas phage OBP]
MSRNKATKPAKKVKQNVERVNRREMIHMDFLDVYNEVLKYEEVIDLDIDLILDVTKSVFARELSLSKLASSPTPEELHDMATKIIDEIRGLKAVGTVLAEVFAKGNGIAPEDIVLKPAA